MGTYRRGEVEFVRGEGALLWDSEGKEYLDLLAGISVCSVGHCHPDVVEAVREQAGRLMHTSQPLLHRADGAPRRAALGVEPRRPRLLRQLGHRGQRVRDQDRPQARPPPRGLLAGDRQLRARLPRPHLRLALGDAGAGGEPGARADARPASARFPSTTPGSACRRRRAHGGGPDRADPGRGRDLPARRGLAARRAGGLRRGRRAPDPRRDPDRCRPNRLALGLRADPGPPRRPDQRQGARRRDGDRRLRHERGGGRGAGAGRPRLDLRRRPGRLGGGSRCPRHRRRPGAAAGA